MSACAVGDVIAATASTIMSNTASKRAPISLRAEAVRLYEITACALAENDAWPMRDVTMDLPFSADALSRSQSSLTESLYKNCAQTNRRIVALSSARTQFSFFGSRCHLRTAAASFVDRDIHSPARSAVVGDERRRAQRSEVGAGDVMAQVSPLGDGSWHHSVRRPAGLSARRRAACTFRRRLDFRTVSPLQTEQLGNPKQSIDVEAVAVSLHIAIRARRDRHSLTRRSVAGASIEQNTCIP